MDNFFQAPYGLNHSLTQNVPNMFQQQVQYMDNVNHAFASYEKFRENCLKYVADQQLQQMMYFVSNNIWSEVQTTPSPYLGEAFNIPEEILHPAQAIAEATGYDCLSALLNILVAANLSLFGRYVLRIHEQWKEDVLIYGFFISSSGTNKSQLFEITNNMLFLFLKKIIMKNSELHKMKDKNIIKKMTHRKYITKAVNALCDEDGYIQNGNDIDKKLQPYLEMIENLELTNEQPELTFFAENASEVQIFDMAEANNGTILFVAPEAKRILADIKTGKQDINIFLRGHNGELIERSRKTKQWVIPRLAISMNLHCQSDVAYKFFNNEMVTDTGLAARFMCFFLNKMNHPATLISPEVTKAIEDYNKMMHQMVDYNYSAMKAGEIFTLSLTADARDLLTKFSQDNYLQANSLQNGRYKSFIFKLAGLSGRLAATIHLLLNKSRHDKPIDRNIVHLAIQLAMYLQRHAYFIFEPRGYEASINAKKIMEWIQRHRQVAFTSRDIAQYSGVKLNAKIFPALDVLECHGIVKQIIKANAPRVCLVNSSWLNSMPYVFA